MAGNEPLLLTAQLIQEVEGSLERHLNVTCVVAPERKVPNVSEPPGSLRLSALSSTVSPVFVSCRRASSVRPAPGTNGHQGLGASAGRGGAPETGDPTPTPHPQRLYEEFDFIFSGINADFTPTQVLSINEEGLRRCEDNTRVFGRPIRCGNTDFSVSGS